MGREAEAGGDSHSGRISSEEPHMLVCTLARDQVRIWTMLMRASCILNWEVAAAEKSLSLFSYSTRGIYLPR